MYVLLLSVFVVGLLLFPYSRCERLPSGRSLCHCGSTDVVRSVRTYGHPSFALDIGLANGNHVGSRKRGRADRYRAEDL